jgi:hypothetical protein
MKFGRFELKFEKPEFVLVVVMLVSLVLVVTFVLWIPLTPDLRITNSTDVVALTEDILKARTDLLTIIITAFGAGAAYFFGKENLKTTTESMLSAFGSPQAKLAATKVKDISPHRIGITYKETDKFEKVYDWIWNEPDIWFVTIIDDKDGSLKVVLHEEAFYRYRIEQLQNHTSQNIYSDLILKNLLEWIDKQSKKLGDEVAKFWIDIDMNTDLNTAQTNMAHENARLAIIVDEKHAPTHFITTGDIRKFILAS